MAEQFANQATSTLTAAISAGATTLAVKSASKFPAEGDFRIVVGGEIMLVTGVASKTFTVSRGQEGTTATTHASGDTVAHVLTAAALATKENASNKDTSGALGASDTKYPSQKAVKTYVDAADLTLASSIQIINLGTDWSAGENRKGYAAAVTGQRQSILHGSNASPDTTAAPTVKIVRTSAISQAAINAVEGSEGSDGGDVMAAIMAVHGGAEGSGSQTVGVAGFAKNASNSEENPDACGLYGVGRIIGGTSTQAGAFGAFLLGRRDVSTATATGLEIQAQNYTAVAGSYKSNGSSDTKGIWLNANGESDSGVGIQIQNAFGHQFKVGIGFGNQNTGGKIGGVADSTIRDDSESTVSLDIRGKHSTGLMVRKEAGVVLVGAEALTGESPPQLMEIHAGGVAKTPLFKLTAGANVNITQIFNNSTANFTVGLAGAVNGLMTGAAIGDGAISTAAGKIVHIGRSATRASLRVGENNVAIGFTAADSFGSGKGVVFLANAEAAPSANPTGGGILYTEGGALKYRGSSGTVTTVGVA